MIFEYAQNTESKSKTEYESIENSIGTIASTAYATAPFLRSMGIKHYVMMSDSEIDHNRYATEVISECSRWEDRAQVKAVRIDNNVVKVVLENVTN